jgi:aurora kinase
MAPEVLKCPPKVFPEENKGRAGLSYNVGADVWSIGVLAYELVMGTPPFPITTGEKQGPERGGGT